MVTIFEGYLDFIDQEKPRHLKLKDAYISHFKEIAGSLLFYCEVSKNCLCLSVKYKPATPRTEWLINLC